MLERFDDQARLVIEHAHGEAAALGHDQVGTEHLLLGLLAAGDSGAARALMSCGATLEGCRAKATEAVASKRQGTAGPELTFTDRASRALERAGRLSLREKRGQVDPTHILLSVLDVEGTAGQVLRGLSVDLGCVRETIKSAGVVAASPETPETLEFAEREPPGSVPRCPGCQADLAGGLGHRVVASRGEDGKVAQWMLAYCTSCGTAVAGHRGTSR